MFKLSEQLNRSPTDIIGFRQHQSLTVSDLTKLVNQLSLQIQKSPYSRWAIMVDDSFHFVASLLALFYNQKPPVLLSALRTDYLQETHQYFDALLTDQPIDTLQYQTLFNEIIQIDDSYLSDRKPYIVELKPFSEQLSLTLFTSGSTGAPKPIKKTIQQFANESEILAKHWHDSLSNSIIFTTVSHQHLYGLTFKIMLSLALGIPFVCEMVRYQEQLVPYHNQKITLIASPAFLKTLDKSLPPILCQHVFSAGGPLSFEEAHDCLSCFRVLPNEIYGSSETGVIATRQQHKQQEPWQAFEQVNISLCHENQTLIVQSPLLFDEKAEQLNDRIEQLDSHHFHLLGRTDNIIKIAEQRISLTHIEKQLNALLEIEQSAIIPLKQNLRIIIAAVIVLSESGQVQLSRMGEVKLGLYLRQQLRDKMPFIALPKRWRFVDEIPVNQQGKRAFIDLKALFITR